MEGSADGEVNRLPPVGGFYCAQTPEWGGTELRRDCWSVSQPYFEENCIIILSPLGLGKSFFLFLSYW